MGNGIKVTITGDRKMQATLSKAAKEMPQETGAAMFQEEQIEMTEMKKRTPVDQGNLKNSGFVKKPVIKGTNIIVEATFGGPSIEYALIVHEDPDAHHPVGQWKYMESVQNESAPHMAQRIAKRIDLNKVV